MADIIYINGAEHGVLSTLASSLYSTYVGSNGSVISIDSTVAKTGSRSLKFSIAAAASAHCYISKSSYNGGTGESGGRFAFRKSANPSAQVAIGVIDVGGVDVVNIFLNADGSLTAKCGINGNLVTSGVLSNGAWHEIVFCLDTAGGTWVFQWEVNNVTQTTSSDSTRSAQTAHGIYLGGNAGTATNVGAFDFWIDDLVLTYSVSDFPLAPMEVRPLTVNGVGTHTLDASPSVHFFQHDGSSPTALTNSETNSYTRLDKIVLPSTISDRLQLTPLYGSYTTPSFVSAGAVGANAGTFTPGLPASTQDLDVIILVVVTENETAVTLSGGNLTWSQIGIAGGAGVGTGSAVDAVRVQVFWARRGATAPTMPTISDSGDHQHARAFAYRGCVQTGSPISANINSTESGNTDASGSATGITTTVANELVLLAVGTALPDTADTGAQFSAWANANLSATAERADHTTNIGTGSGLGLWEGLKASAGATGNTTFTTAQNTAKAMMMFSLKGHTPITQPSNTIYAEYNVEDSAGTDTIAAVIFHMAVSVGTVEGSPVISMTADDGTFENVVINAFVPNQTTVHYASNILRDFTGPWSDTKLDALRLRIGKTANASGVIDISGVMMEVAYFVSGGPALTPIALSANLTATPVISRVGQYKKAPAVTMTMTPALNRMKFDTEAIGLTMSSVVSLVRRKNVTVPAGLTLTGGISMRLTRLVNMAASLPLTAALIKKGQYFKTLPATVTFTNVITMRMTRVRLLAAGLTATAVLNRRLNRTVAAGVTLAPVITFGKFLQKQINATVTNTPVLSFVKVKLQALPANLTMTGAMTLKAIGQKLIAGTLTMQPTQNRRLNKTVAAGVTMTPVFVRKGVYYKTLALMLTLSPNVTTRKTVYQVIAATVTHTAQMTMIRILKLQLSANMPITTALNRRLNRTLNSGLNLVGVVQADKLVGIRFISLPATLTLGVSMVKVLSGSKLLSAAVTLDTALNRLKVAPRLLAAPVTLQPALVRRLNRTIAATVTTNPVITPLKMKFVTIAATITNSVVITRLKLASRTLAATLATTNVIARLNKKRLEPTLTLDPVVRRRYFRTLVVNMATQPVIDRISNNGLMYLDATVTMGLKIEKAIPRTLAGNLILQPVISFNRAIMRFRDWLLSAKVDEPVLDSAEIDQPELISATWTDDQ